MDLSDINWTAIQDLRKDLEFIQDGLLASWAERVAKVEGSILSLDDKMNIFVPKNGSDNKGFEAAFGKFLTTQQKHSKEITKLKELL